MRARRAAPGGRALGAVLALALAGCAAVPRPVPLPAGDPRPAALVAALAERTGERHALRGVARLSLDGPAGSGRAKQILLVERPARLRVELLGWLDQTVAVLTTDGASYQLFRAEDRTLERGAVHPGLLWEVAGLAVTPEQAVSLLLGEPPLAPDARVIGGARLGEDGLRALLVEPGAAGRTELDFDGAGRLVAWRRFGAGEAPVQSARWEDHRPVPGATAPFPFEIEIVDHTTEARAAMSFSRVELDPELDPSLFALPAGAAR